MRHEALKAAIRWSGALVLALVLAAAPASAPAYSRDGKEDGNEVEEQLQRINTQLMELQTKEFDLTMKIQQAQQKAQQGLEDPGKATQQLAQGKRSRELMRYKAVLVASAQKVQQFDRRMLPLLKQAKGLQKKQNQVEKPVQVMIDQTVARVEAKHRGNLEKIARFYKQAAEHGQALRIYREIYSMIPEAERDKNEDLVKSIGDLYAKGGNPKGALNFYNKIFEAKKPKDRYKDKNLAKTVAELHVKTGNGRAALAIYRGLLDQIPNDKKHKGEREGILKKINALTSR